MKILRNNTDMLCQVVDAFRADPSFKWSCQADRAAEQGNWAANRAILQIKEKMRGRDPRQPHLDLSQVEAHVEYLIEAACDPTNLAVMFTGWKSLC